MVAHAEMELVVGYRQAEFDFTGGRRKIDRIVDQIQQGLLQEQGIALNERRWLGL